MLKVKTNKAAGYDNIPPRAKQGISWNTILSVFFLTISWKIRGYLNDGNSVKSHQLKKGLLSNQIKLQTNNYTTVFVENLRNANSFQNQSWLFWRYFSRTCIRIQVGSRNWYCCTQANEKDPSIWNKKVSWYLAFIILHFNYCSPETWHFCNENITAKLEKVNELALRFFFLSAKNERHIVNYLIK